MAKKRKSRKAVSKQATEDETHYNLGNDPLPKIGSLLQLVGHLLNDLEPCCTSDLWAWDIVKRVNPGLATVIGICAQDLSSYENAERSRRRA